MPMIRTQADKLLPVFAQMVIVRAECDFHRDLIEYIAYSPLFDKVAPGAEAPSYDLVTSPEGVSVSKYRPFPENLLKAANTIEQASKKRTATQKDMNRAFRKVSRRRDAAIR